jgi:hypothetical protein
MTASRKSLYLLATCVGLILLPYFGGWIAVDGAFPADYFEFPPLKAPEKSPFSLLVFIIASILFSALLLVYAVPGLYGFKVVPEPPAPLLKKTRLPPWFWIGLVMWGVTLLVLWGKFSEPKWIIYWAAIPLFWGFTLMLDGWAYVRNNGNSLISNSFREVLAMGVASISGWLIFEFLNFFVLDNWIYPAGLLLDDDEFVIYAVLGSSGLMPMCFEWYYILKTSRFFRNRFTYGPKLTVPDWVVTLILIVGLGSLSVIAFFPDLLFGFLWLAPLCVLAAALSKLKIWTPFALLKEGNWTPVLLFNIAYLIQGFLVEFWNYFSAIHHEDGTFSTHNPDYWSYSVPYVNVLHVFEMPLLGFLGYMPFGLYCVIWWITFAYLLNISYRFPETEPGL